MKIFITGICGYVGSRLALSLLERIPGAEIWGIDNLSRPGAELHRVTLLEAGVRVAHGDVRLASDWEEQPAPDWVIDCAANPTVLAGRDPASGASPRQLFEHNLIGTLHTLEFCRRTKAGLVMLSTNRVYSINALQRLPLKEEADRFVLQSPLPRAIAGVTAHGITKDFSTEAPVSLYGATKRASEIMALEYAEAFGFPVWINRCGVIGGPGQLGKADQGIFSFWVYSCATDKPLRYIGWGGRGKQVRDCIPAENLAELVFRQLRKPAHPVSRVLNVGGGPASALSLRQVTEICQDFFKRPIHVAATPEERPYDIPFYVTDLSQVKADWDWSPEARGEQLIVDLCRWTERHRDFVKALPV